MERWETILTLKENHEVLGCKGWEFFICDFPKNIQTDMIDYVIAQPVFIGDGVGKGVCSWVLDNKQMSELFEISEKTFQEVAEELEDSFWEKESGN